MLDSDAQVLGRSALRAWPLSTHVHSACIYRRNASCCLTALGLTPEPWTRRGGDAIESRLQSVLLLAKAA